MVGESGFTIRFDLDPGHVCYAGRTVTGELAIAPTIDTAEVWATRTIAGNFLANGYGPGFREVGSVVEVVDGVEVELEPAS